jgi:hypothetical protein
VAILTAAIAVFFIDVLLGTGTFYVRDLVWAGHPTRTMLRETVLAGELPQWNRWIGGGQPLAANPAYQAFYPPNALILLPGFLYGFNLFLLLHVLIAAWGMYGLLRSMEAGPPASAVAAASFAFGATLAVHDLIPILTCLAWLPWTCLFARRFLRGGRRRDFALAALFLGIQVLIGELAVVLQTGAILGVYAVSRPRALRNTGAVALLCLVAVLLAMVQVLPAADLAADSVRSRGFAFDKVVSWSMPAARLIELLNPNVLGHQFLNGRAVYWGSLLYGERGLPFVRSIYPGILMTLLALAGFAAGVRGRRVTGILLAVSILLALGSQTPLWRWLYDLGLAKAIRYPEKFMLMGLFALTVFAGLVLDRLLAGDERVLRIARRTSAGALIVLGVVALLAVTALHAQVFVRLWKPDPRVFAEMLPASRSGWLLTFVRAALVFTLLRNAAWERRRVWLALLAGFVLLDLGAVVPEVAPRMPRAYFDEPPAIVSEFKARHRDCRLFHVAAWQPAGPYLTQRPDLYWLRRNALYPMMPASWGIPTVLEPDLDRTSLLPSADFVDAVWALSRKDPQWLESVAPAANICAVAVFQDPKVAFAERDTTRVQPVRLIHLPDSPRYSLMPAKAGVVGNVRETPNTARIEVETTGPALLSMSVTPHKYWRVKVDGKPAEAVPSNLGFQGVPLGAGRHVVEMRYRNPLLAIGGAISLLTLLVLVWKMR